jgi:hypothetical protein
MLDKEAIPIGRKPLLAKSPAWPGTGRKASIRQRRASCEAGPNAPERTRGLGTVELIRGRA